MSSASDVPPASAALLPPLLQKLDVAIVVAVAAVAVAVASAVYARNTTKNNVHT